MATAKNSAVRVILLALTALPVSVVAEEAATATDKWHSVAKTDNQEAFVNPASLAMVGAFVEVRAKQNFVQPQPAAKKGKTFLSTRAVYRFDCAQRKVAMKELRAYAAADLQGDTVQKAKTGDRNLQWLDAPESTVFGELLDYACRPR